MNQANKKGLTFLEDDKSTGIILVWPSIYENQFFWSGLLGIYYELIKTCLESDKSIFLVIKKERDINNDLKLINRNINTQHYPANYLLNSNSEDFWVLN